MTETTPIDPEVSDAPVEAPVAASLAAETGGTVKTDETKEDKPEGSTTTTEESSSAPVATNNGKDAGDPPGEKAVEEAPASAPPVVSASKRSRPLYKYDPNKITLRFLFANRDGLTVTVECRPTDTVSEVKGALLSVWPEDLPACSDGDRLRLICMGKGILMPDTRNLADCEVPVFKTHPTPINVSVRPEDFELGYSKGGGEGKSGRGVGSSSGGTGPAAGRSNPGSAGVTDQGCACIIL